MVWYGLIWYGCLWRCLCVHESVIGNLNFVSSWGVSVIISVSKLMMARKTTRCVRSCLQWSWIIRINHQLTPLSKIYTKLKQQHGDIVTFFIYSWPLDAKNQEPLNVKSQNHRDFMASKPMLLPNNKNLSNCTHTHNSAHIYCAGFMFYLPPPLYTIKHRVLKPGDSHSKEKEPKFPLPNHRSPRASCDHLDHRHVPHHPSPLHHWHWHCCHQLKPWPEFTLRLYKGMMLWYLFHSRLSTFGEKVEWWGGNKKVKGDLLSAFVLGEGWNKHSKPCRLEVNHPVFVWVGRNWSHAKMLQETTTLPPGHNGNESQHRVEVDPDWLCLKGLRRLSK